VGSKWGRPLAEDAKIRKRRLQINGTRMRNTKARVNRFQYIYLTTRIPRCAITLKLLPTSVSSSSRQRVRTRPSFLQSLALVDLSTVEDAIFMCSRNSLTCCSLDSLLRGRLRFEGGLQLEESALVAQHCRGNAMAYPVYGRLIGSSVSQL
jgi:hypothetical protein